MRSLFLTTFVLLISVHALSAEAQVRAEGGLSIGVGIPTGDFGDQLDATGFGGHLFGAIGIPESPFMVGLDLGFLTYGRERRNEAFSTTIPDVRVDVVTNNNLINGHLFLRLQPDVPGLRPYADALFGFKHLFTQTRIRNDGFSNEDIARSTNFDDTALSYGFGGGLQFQVFSGAGRDEGPGAVFIDVGAKYLIGTQAAYLKEGSIRRENGSVTFDVTKSETTVLLILAGVTLKL